MEKNNIINNLIICEKFFSNLGLENIKLTAINMRIVVQNHFAKNKNAIIKDCGEIYYNQLENVVVQMLIEKYNVQYEKKIKPVIKNKKMYSKKWEKSALEKIKNANCKITAKNVGLFIDEVLNETIQSKNYSNKEEKKNIRDILLQRIVERLNIRFDEKIF